MSRILEKVRQDQTRQNIPAFRPGDTVRVHVRLKEAEGEKERLQPFEGVVISRRGNLSGATFTVRRVSFGIGVERIFPVNSPMISSIEILQAGRVRRAKLYYLRALKGKAARIRRAERPSEPAAAAAEKN
jgi:large subunit ribosomal protein L19